MDFQIPYSQFTEENINKLFHFLESRNWQRQQAESPYAVFYINKQPQKYGLSKLIFPSKIISGNIPQIRQVSDAVRALAYYYEQTPSEFWNRLQESRENFDTIYIIECEGQNINSIPITPALSLLGNMLNTLDSAMSLYDYDESYFFSKNSRMGHSFRGSYGISIEIPLRLQYQMPLEQEEILIIKPNERKAIELLFQTLQLVEFKETFERIKHVSFEYPLFYESLYKLVQSATHSDITINAKAAVDLPFDSIVKKIKFTTNMLSIMEHVRTDDELQEQQRYLEIEGIVVGLEWDHNLFAILHNTKKLSIKIYDEKLGKNITIKNVDPNDYLLALEAHRLGKPIKAEGLVNMNKRQLIMKNASLRFSS